MTSSSRVVAFVEVEATSATDFDSLQKLESCPTQVGVANDKDDALGVAVVAEKLQSAERRRFDRHDATSGSRQNFSLAQTESFA
jgi:hypothetical protein